MTELFRTCPACGAAGGTDIFFRNKRRPDGLAVYCKSCEKARKQANAESVNAYNRAWRAEHADQVRARDRERSQRPERKAGLLSVHRRYRQNHVIKVREQAKAYRLAHPELYREADRRRAGTPLRLAGKRRHYLRHRDAYFAAFHKRRARKAGNGGHHTPQEWSDLCAAFDHRCACCLQHRPLTRDHVIPIVAGGTDFIANIQPLCGPCNRRKGVKDMDYRPTFHQRLAQHQRGPIAIQ